MSAWGHAGVAYALGTAFALVVGNAASLTQNSQKDRRFGARLILTCWAWPVWIALGAVGAARYLWDEAGWGK